jgi:hypothetical protein
MYFYTNDTLALTLDTSQNATFAGAVTLNGTDGHINLDGNNAVIFDNSNNNNAYYIRNGGTSSATLQIGTGSSPGSNIKLTLDGSGNATFAGTVISTDGTDTATLSYTGLNLSRSNSYIQSNADNEDTLNIGQAATRWGNIKVDGATFKVLNGGNERFGIDSSGNATFAGTVSVTAADSITIADYILHSGDDSKFGFPSDDTFKIRTGGVDRFTLTNTDATFANTVDVDGDVNIQAGALSITSDGSNKATFTETGAGLLTIAAQDDIVLAAASDITLDATGNDIRLFNAGTQYGHFKQYNQGVGLYVSIQDMDFVVRGNDGGTTFSAFGLDMSEGGNATFAGRCRC